MNYDYLKQYKNIYNYLTANHSFDNETKDILLSLKTPHEFELVEKLMDDDLDFLFPEKLKSEYIKEYGIDLLYKNFNTIAPSILEKGLTNKRIKKVMFTLFENDITISHHFSNLEETPLVDKKYIKEIIPLLKDNCYAKFILDNLIDNDKGTKFLYKATAEDSNERTILNLITLKYGYESQVNYQKLLEVEDKENLCKFIKLMPNEYFNNKSKIERFIKLYKKNETLMSTLEEQDLENPLIKRCFKEYIMDANREKFHIDSKEKLENIRNIRYEFYLDKIENTDDINKIKTYITENYFGMRYKKYLKKLKEISNMEEKCSNMNNQEHIQKYFILQIHFINDKELLKKQYENALYYWNCFDEIDEVYSYFDNLNNKVKTSYQEDVINNLTTIPQDQKVIYYDEEPFYFLVHKIKGYNNKEKAKELKEKPKQWLKNAKYYLDVSTISQDRMGVVPGDGIIFVFNDIKANNIISMGIEDTYTDENNIKGKVINLKEDWGYVEEQEQKSINSFDNYAIKKEDGKEQEPFIPNAVLCFNEIDLQTKEASEIFDIPIILINKEKYLEQTEIRLNECLKEKNIDEYYRLKRQMYMSVYKDRELVNKFFSPNKLKTELDNIIENTNPKKSRDLKLLSKVIEIDSYIINNTGNYDEDELNKMLDLDKGEVNKLLSKKFKTNNLH